jgi:zinc finger SWIM domain-containing protein 3
MYFFPNNQLFVETQQQDEAIKPRGVKIKAKEVCGSERPIGGFEKTT